MYTTMRRFTFEAAHYLKHLPASDKRSQPHGHSYTVDVVISCARLDDNGLVVGEQIWEGFARYLSSTLDHRDLNVVLPIKTTAENLACHLFKQVEMLIVQAGHRLTVELVSVRVSEDNDSWAEYTR